MELHYVGRLYWVPFPHHTIFPVGSQYTSSSSGKCYSGSLILPESNMSAYPGQQGPAHPYNLVSCHSTHCSPSCHADVLLPPTPSGMPICFGLWPVALQFPVPPALPATRPPTPAHVIPPPPSDPQSGAPSTWTAAATMSIPYISPWQQLSSLSASSDGLYGCQSPRCPGHSCAAQKRSRKVW